MTDKELAERIRTLAQQGNTLREVISQIEESENKIRKVASENSISFPARRSTMACQLRKIPPKERIMRYLKKKTRAVSQDKIFSACALSNRRESKEALTELCAEKKISCRVVTLPNKRRMVVYSAKCSETPSLFSVQQEETKPIPQKKQNIVKAEPADQNKTPEKKYDNRTMEIALERLEECATSLTVAVFCLKETLKIS